VLGIIAAILASRKRWRRAGQHQAVPGSNCAIQDAIVFAERIMRESDHAYSK